MFATSVFAQCDPNNPTGFPCTSGPCCQIYNACNYGYYDPALSATDGCDLCCAPIDSGVLFLLVGGGLFGGFFLARRKELELVATK